MKGACSPQANNPARAVKTAGLPSPLSGGEVSLSLHPSSFPGLPASPFQISAGQHQGS